MTNHHPDYEAAKNFALDILTNGLPEELYYHNSAHTLDEVLPAMEEFADQEEITGEPRSLLRIATLYHDIGFINAYDEHVQEGILIVRSELPGFGFSPDQIDTICGMIMATHLPQSPTSLLEMILADADLSILGRSNFAQRNELLLRERIAYGRGMSEQQWYCDQLSFLEQHRYFTQPARETRGPVKRRNIQMLNQRLAVSS
jgi:uncharacterized protein